MQKELHAMVKRAVYDDIAATELHREHFPKGNRTNNSPARRLLVKKLLHDGTGGWEPKARIV